MTVGAYIILRSMARRWRAGEDDLPSPYGPQDPEQEWASRAEVAR
jgi:cytochrome d ubiquinol oxidase subunit I